jgi:hypothetical protein
MIAPASRWKYAAFHVFGMLDFVLAVGTGLTFSVLNVPLMENIAAWPMVIIPLFGVCVTGSLSVMTLDRLVREARCSDEAVSSQSSKIQITTAVQGA